MHRDRNTRRPFTCESHEGLARTEQDACARLLPRTTRDQMAFLLMRYHGNSRAVAAVLDVSWRAVERHAKGTVLPAGTRLSTRLRETVLDALCSVRVEVAAARAAKRGRRRPQEDD